MMKLSICDSNEPSKIKCTLTPIHSAVDGMKGLKTHVFDKGMTTGKSGQTFVSKDGVNATKKRFLEKLSKILHCLFTAACKGM